MKNKLRKLIPFVILSAVSLAIVAPLAVFVAPEVAQAATPAAPTGQTTESSLLADIIVGGVSKIVELLISLFGKLTIQLIHILILVAGYNSFMTAPAVTTGWVIVRDVANLFFVALILVVSIGSIVNPDRFKGPQQVFRILLFALLVNFSRTIAGLFIDVSQLVMLTFVNGFAQAAGGNFVEALGVTKLTDFPQTGGALVASETIASLFLALFMFVIITVIIAVMVVALVVRMVTLWILIVLSPIAFAAGASDSTKEHYNLWWKKFSAELTFGPIVAFFLWLSLVSFQQSSTGTELTGQQLKSGGNGTEQVNVTCGSTVACSQENMIRFIVASCMLLIGLGFAKEFSGVGGDLAKGALSKGKQYATTAARWTARKTALPAAVLATGGIAGGAAVGGIALAARSQRIRTLTGKGLSKVPGLRSAGLRLQANVAKERMDSLKKSEETAKYGTWQQMKARTYTYDKNTGKVSEDLTVNRDTALANYKLLMKDKDWLSESSETEKKFVMGKATQYAREINDKESLDLVADVEKSNPNLIPADKKATDPVYNTQPETSDDPRFHELMDSLSPSDGLKMDFRAFTPKVVAKLPEGAIEKVLKDGNSAQIKALGDVLRQFADKSDTRITKKDRDEYYEKIENNKRGVDTLSTPELESADMVAAVMTKPPTKDREDLFKNKEKKAVIGTTANKALNDARSKTGFVYDDKNARLAEAAAVADESIDNAYRSRNGMINDTNDRAAFEKALRGKSQADIAFAVKLDDINPETHVGASMANVLTAADIANLAKKAEGNTKKEDIVKTIIKTMREVAASTAIPARKIALEAEIKKIEKSPATNKLA